MQFSAYHAFLRISSLTVALVLLFESGLISPLTQDLSHQAGRHLASVIGINAAVSPTELNTMTAQLTQREQELREREIAVQLKEEGNEPASAMSTYLLSILLFILLVLIILNYALDYVRNKQAQYEQTA